MQKIYLSVYLNTLLVFEYLCNQANIRVNRVFVSVLHDSIEVMNFRYHPKEASVHLPVPMWNIKPTILISGEEVIITGYSHAEAHSDGSYEISIASLLGHPLSTKQWSELCPPPSHNTATVPYSNPPILVGGITAGVATYI